MVSGEVSHSSVGIGDFVCLLRELEEILEMEWGYVLLRIKILEMVKMVNLHKCYIGWAAIGNGAIGNWLEVSRISSGSVVEYNAWLFQMTEFGFD